MHLLDDPGFTLAYARKHLNELEAAIRVRQVLEPDVLASQFDPQRSCCIFRYKLPEPPPLGVALQLGDVVHNMRASLDHLAWRLARLTMKVPSRDTHFPIFDSPNAGALHTQIREMPSGAQQIIEGLQPYHRGNRMQEDLLWLLNQLCIVAKHRHINVVGVYASFEIKLPALTTSEIERVNEREIMVTVPVRDEVEEDLKPCLSVEITLGINEPGYGRGVLVLTDIHDFIRDDIFPRFECFFPEKV
jgi:hypothetical protein